MKLFYENNGGFDQIEKKIILGNYLGISKFIFKSSKYIRFKIYKHLLELFFNNNKI